MLERLVKTPPREDGATESPPAAEKRDASFPSSPSSSPLSSGGGGEGRYSYNGDGGGDGGGDGAGGEERRGSDVDVGDDAGALEASESAVEYLDGRALKEMEPSPMSNRHVVQAVGTDGLTLLPIPSMKVTPPLPSPLPLGALGTPPHPSAGVGVAGGLPQPRGKATLLPLTSL